MVRRLYACPGFPKTCRHMCITGLSSYQLRCSRRYCRGCGNRSVHPGLGCWRILLWWSFPHRFKHLHGAEGASHTKFELYLSNLWWVFWFETISQNSTRTTCWSFASSVGSSGSSALIAFKQFASMQPMPFSKVDADQPCWRTGFGDGILLSTRAPKWGGAKVPSFIYLWIQVTKFRVSWGMLYLSFATICSNGFGADNFARNHHILIEYNPFRAKCVRNIHRSTKKGIKSIKIKVVVWLDESGSCSYESGSCSYKSGSFENSNFAEIG